MSCYMFQILFTLMLQQSEKETLSLCCHQIKMIKICPSTSVSTLSFGVIWLTVEHGNRYDSLIPGIIFKCIVFIYILGQASKWSGPREIKSHWYQSLNRVAGNFLLCKVTSQQICDSNPSQV